MNVKKIGQSNYNYVGFYGKSRYSNFLEKFSLRDIYSDTKPDEFIELRKIYNDLWKELGLADNLKPRIQYKAMLSNMAFSLEDYMVFVEKRVSLFKMGVRNKTGMNKSTLRHEIEHVKQFWDIIRLIGADNMAEELKNNLKTFDIDVTPKLLSKMREIETTLGRISPDSNEYNKAKQYLDALRNYPDTNKFFGINLKQITEYIKYEKNLLEVEARKEAKKYKPTYIKTIRTVINEFWKLLSR